jgi:hypothetical protein
LALGSVLGSVSAMVSERVLVKVLAKASGLESESDSALAPESGWVSRKELG